MSSSLNMSEVKELIQNSKFYSQVPRRSDFEINKKISSDIKITIKENPSNNKIKRRLRDYSQIIWSLQENISKVKQLEKEQMQLDFIEDSDEPENQDLAAAFDENQRGQLVGDVKPIKDPSKSQAMAAAINMILSMEPILEWLTSRKYKDINEQPKPVCEALRTVVKDTQVKQFLVDKHDSPPIEADSLIQLVTEFDKLQPATLIVHLIQKLMTEIGINISELRGMTDQ